jgi:GxxExxY protein
MEKKIIHKELSYKLNGIFYHVHNQLGRYLSHKQYLDAIEGILKEKGIRYEREIDIPIKFAGNLIKGNRINLLVEGIILVDIKKEKFITKADFMQMLRYLKAANLELGIIVNFRQKTLRPKRVINANYKPVFV